MLDYRQSSPELNALVEITQILTGTLPFLEKCDSVLAVLADFTSSDFVVLRELDEENSALDLVSCHDLKNLPELSFATIPLGDIKASAKAIEDGTPRVINDYPADGTANQVYLSAGVKSVLILPIIIDDKIAGTLSFGSKYLNHYREETVNVLTSIAAVVGMMIAKAELQDANEVEANVGRIVSSALVGPDVFERFAAEAGRIIDFERLSLDSVNIPEGTFITEFLIGEEIPHYPIAKTQELSGTALDAVIRSRTSQSFRLDDRDGSELKRPHAAPFVAAGQPYLINVPLIVGDQIIGTMGFIRGSRHFSRKDLAKADRLGNLIAGAFADFKSEAYRRAAENEIRESEERFRQMAENMRGAFWLFDINDKRMLYVSPHAEDVWGYSAEQFYDDHFGWIELVHPDDRNRVRSEVENQRVTGEINTEYRIVRSDGSIRWVSARGFPIKDSEGRMAGIGEDITEQKSALQRVMQASHLASIGGLSAGVAHEINNPLTTIILNAEMSLEDDPPEPYKESLRMISEQGKRAAKIVQNLLAFARKSDANKSEFSLAGLVLRVLEIKEPEFRINNIKTVVNVEPDLPTVSVDAHLMTQVMTNLLTNAEQACSAAHGSGVLTVTGSVVDENVRISVSDDGPGIPSDDLSKIFEPFSPHGMWGPGRG